ncbi:MAG: UDP-N-acetylglucosamine 1-carboxyvinyltransferase, partial [Cyanobacteriota bacterium]|nr:UDP-N-acetylglucosamine 1-carboxyvinyltransferase [Cyanobacteriota bacterium]
MKNTTTLSASDPTTQPVSVPKNTAVLKIGGKQPLSGCVPISGAKNSALAIMAGVLLCPEQCRI